MALTPEQIARREFFTVLRGYDKAEVEEFLHEVASDYAALLEAYESAQNTPVDAYESVGQEVSVLLKTARESSDSLLAQAQSKADELLRQAESDAKIAREKADATAHDLLVDAERRVALLRQNEGELRARLDELSAMINDVRSLLDEQEEESSGGPPTEPFTNSEPAPRQPSDEDLIVITDPQWSGEDEAEPSPGADDAREEPTAEGKGAVRAPRPDEPRA
jgi:DivIVA domain-containing protein